MLLQSLSDLSTTLAHLSHHHFQPTSILGFASTAKGVRAAKAMDVAAGGPGAVGTWGCYNLHFAKPQHPHHLPRQGVCKSWNASWALGERRSSVDHL